MNKLSALALVFVASISAHAMDPAKAYDDTTIVREVSYNCLANKNVVVTYGFSRDKKPTYASAFLGGKDRFMAINLDRSDRVDTVFGTEDNYRLASEDFNLNTYHRRGVNIQTPGNEILYKNCRFSSMKKVR